MSHRPSALAHVLAMCSVVAAVSCSPRAQAAEAARVRSDTEALADDTPPMRARVSPYMPRTAPAAAHRGDPLIIPVQGVTPGQLHDSFGDSRSSARRHGAIDIMAPPGTPVLAAAGGKIVKLDNGERGGIALYEIAPDQRTIYYYAHLQKYANGVAEGRHIDAGDIIGYVGDTGNAGIGNYHLHFEIMTTADPRRYWGGEQINPYPLLREGITR